MKKEYWILLLIFSTLFISGCINTKSSENSSNNLNNDEIVAAVGRHGGEPNNGFDPILGWGYDHETLIQSTLFKRDSNANLITDIATNYSISPDGLTWIVNIRDDVKFHNGILFLIYPNIS